MMILILTNIIQNIILNNIQEALAVGWTLYVIVKVGGIVTFKPYKSQNKMNLMKMNLIVVFWKVLEISYKNM